MYMVPSLYHEGTVAGNFSPEIQAMYHKYADSTLLYSALALGLISPCPARLAPSNPCQQTSAPRLLRPA